MAHLTLKKINAAIAERGGKEVLVKGEGYFYFIEGDAWSWSRQSVYVYRLNDMSLEAWMQAWESRRDEYQEELKRGF
jgi:hypothetical protein